MPPVAKQDAIGVTLPPPLPRKGFWETAAIQVRVLDAMIIRNLLTRYGRDNIGFVWIIIQPILLCLLMAAVWSVRGRLDGRGISVVSFALTGFMLLSLWRFMSTGVGMKLIQRNRGLLFHRRITFMDALLSAQMLEFLGTTTAMVTVTWIMLTLKVIPPIHDYGLVVAAWVLMALFGFGFGALVAALTAWSRPVQEVLPPMQLVITVLSGAFFMVAWLPEVAREILVYLPLIHAYEAMRAGFIGPIVTTYHDLAYGYAWAIAVNGFSLWLLGWVWRNVEVDI